MLRLLLYFRCGQSQQLAPRESPQITNLPQHFRHHLWGTLRRWRHDGYNNIFTNGHYNNNSSWRYWCTGYTLLQQRLYMQSMHIHYIRVLQVYSIIYMPYIHYVSFWYTTVHDVQHDHTIAIYSILHASGTILMRMVNHFTSLFFHGALPVEIPYNYNNYLFMRHSS